MSIELLSVLVLFGVFFLLMFLSVPVSVSIGLATIATIVLSAPFDNATFVGAQKMITALDSFALLALPFFILAGNIMNRGGIAMRLINLALVLAGRLPGALAHCNVIANMLFGSISGSAVAAAVGGTMGEMQRKAGYDPGYAAAVNIASCPTGLLIPPSNTFIVYSTISGGTSVAALFLAGYLPGILMGLGIMVVAGIIAYRKKLPVNERVPLNAAVGAFLQAILPLSLIVIVIGDIVKGTFTATEGSAIAVVYALFLAVVVYREIKIKDLPKIFLDSMVTNAIVMLLIGCSSGMSWAMANADIHGASIAAITKRFLHLTGKNTFPPKWSLGYSGSTMSYTDAPDAQQQLQKFIALCREHAIPCDSFQLSSGYTSINGKRYVFNWNRDKIPDPKALARAFRDAGIRLAANIKPCLLHDHPRYREAAEKKLFVQDSDSGAPEISMFWDAEGSHLDFTNPATGAWWRDNVKAQLLDVGIVSTWNDNNEYEIWDDDARCHGFGTPIAIRHIRPLMPLLMMQNSWRAQREHNPHERPYLISRSGCPGLQRYVQTWSGDNRTSWHTLKWNIRMAAGMSLSGMYHIGHDIGGFAGPKPDAELFLRWIQSALLLPRFTIHSWNDDHTVNEPWMHPAITAAVRDAIRLRYRLIPYLYTLLWQAATQDEAIVRPTFLDHEHDETTYADTDDYLIGRDLLVCPVTAPGVRARDIYLPDNTLGWYDYHRGTWHSGGQTLHVPTPLEHLQLYVRAGSIIPEGSLMHADSPDADTERTLRLYPAKGNEKSEGTLYDDNGTAADGAHWQLHWRMHGHGDELYLRLDASGDYQPAYLDNLRVTLPPNETRRLIISGNIAVQQ